MALQSIELPIEPLALSPINATVAAGASLVLADPVELCPETFGFLARDAA
jgi:hypothetical protein